MLYGVTIDGFVPKTLLDIKAEMEADWRAEFGENVDLDPNSPDGQIIGIVADQLAQLWEGEQAVYKAQDPDAAAGQAQDAVCALTGTVRDPASKSTVTLTLTGDEGIVLDVGREVSVDGTGDRFVTLAEGELVALTAWAPATAYTAGNRRTNAGNAYVCITSGTSAGSGGPTTEDDDITDNTAHWRFLGEGDSVDDVAAEAAETGPVSAASGTLTVIETPVSGWLGAINLEDAAVGENEESDDHLRVKREDELAAPGAGTVDSIRATILRVDGVTSCTVYQNNTDSTDGEGRPPHSIAAVVEGGVDAEIAAAIFSRLSAGIQSYGDVDEDVIDSSGNVWTISFSRPNVEDIWVRLDVTVDAETFPVDGEDQLIAAVVDDEANYPIGKDVVASRVSSRAFQVAGVLNVTIAYIGLSNPPVASTTLEMGPADKADFDTSRVTINITYGSP